MADIRAGDAGTMIRFTVKDETGAAADLSGATATEVVIVGPNMAESRVLAALFVTDGMDGEIQFITTADTFPREGVWRMQVHVVTAAGEWRSTVQRLAVEPAL